MLDNYITRTKRLLQNPSVPTQLYPDSDITDWVNEARGQLAGEAECIRVIGTISTVSGTQAYAFSGVNIGVSASTGIDGILNVRRVNYGIASGQRWVTPRPWEWFDYYVLNNPVPVAGVPAMWAQYGQGASPGGTGAFGGGSLYINKPDNAYVLYLDCVCYPIALADDTTKEAIPYIWTDAVPYYAAYKALESAQTNDRMADAERYFNRYAMYVQRARQFSNPSPNRWQSAQAADPAQPSKMGLRQAGG